MKLRGPRDKIKNIIWIRSESQDGANYCDIVNSNDKDTHTLSTSDIGQFISFRAILTDNGNAMVHRGFVGPVLAGPARLLELNIGGGCTVGDVAIAIPKYIGGVEGLSQYWWMRISPSGKREQVSEPMNIIPNDPFVLQAMNAVSRGTQTQSISDHLRGSNVLIDPRLYIITEKDLNCELKVKCRPFRSDGVKGEVFTSKASPLIQNSSGSIITTITTTSAAAADNSNYNYEALL